MSEEKDVEDFVSDVTGNGPEILFGQRNIPVGTYLCWAPAAVRKWCNH